ncbi:MAG: NAD-dependent epimerase/dehydratase family protein, partial [Deltaproteobacteria bacterium]|nr:NAD-dependent epimerase/dehydratase family protein [Deltaproteobacteria bacterium]
MNVFVTGGTGFVGVPLVTALVARGDRVTVLTRNAARARQTLGAVEVTLVEGELETPGSWQAALGGIEAIVHLAGEPVAGKRWDARQKQAIRDSRVEATRALVEAIAALPADQRPRALISASGIDYYPYASGDYDDDEVTEADPPADTFL